MVITTKKTLMRFCPHRGFFLLYGLKAKLFSLISSSIIQLILAFIIKEHQLKIAFQINFYKIKSLLCVFSQSKLMFRKLKITFTEVLSGDF